MSSYLNLSRHLAPYLTQVSAQRPIKRVQRPAIKAVSNELKEEIVLLSNDLTERINLCLLAKVWKMST